jgi:antitoxin CptB
METEGASNAAPPRLYWRARRGMREMDILMVGYLDRRWPLAGEPERERFVALLAELDQDILDWLLERQPAPEAYRDLLPWLRAAVQTGAEP